MSREDELREQIDIYRRRLQKLKEQEALLGTSSSPSLSMELEGIETMLFELQSKLGDKSISVLDTVSVPDLVHVRGKLKNPYTFGVPVSSNEFFGREPELRLIFETLNNVPYGQKQDMVVLGPRRIGKSSLLYHLVDLLTNSRDFVPVYVDIQNIKPRKTRQLFFEISEKIQEGFQRKSASFALPPIDTTRQPASHLREARSHYSPLPSFKTLTAKNILPDEEFRIFKKDLSALNQTVAERRLPRPVVMFDEVELLLEFGGQDMLDWFRSLIQSSPYIIFVVAGSERLYSLTQDYGSPFFNIFKIVALPPLSSEAAKRLVLTPATEIGLEIASDKVDKILRYAGNNPYFIQGICHYLVEILNEQGRAVVYPTDVEQALQESVDKLSGHLAFIWNGVSQVQKILLYQLAASGKPQKSEALLAQIPTSLKEALSRQDRDEIFRDLVRQQILELKQGYCWFQALLFMDWILTQVDDEEIVIPDETLTSPPTPRYNLRALRNLLTTGFTLEELRDLCFYTPELRPVYDLSSGSRSKQEMIRSLLDYVDRKGLQRPLLTEVEKMNPVQFEAFKNELYR